MTTNDQLIRAVQVATRKLASSGNFDLLIKDVLAICVEAVGATGGTIYLHDSASHRLRFQHVLPEGIADKLPAKDIAEDFGLAGQAFQSRSTIAHEFESKPESEWNSFERATGVPVLNTVATPLMMEDEEPIGVVQLLNKEDGSFNASDAAVLDIIAAVATMAYMNFRLTEESARASTLLGMGKVSHDIGNLAASLYSTLSYREMAVNGLREQLSEETQDDRVCAYIETVEPVFSELKSSVDRIVGYSRLVSDISAGRALRPNKVMGSLGATIENSAAFLSTDARSNRVLLALEIDPDAPPTKHDELYFFRIIQNLIGNAIKAVKETIPDDWDGNVDDDDVENTPMFGKVTVRYRFEAGMHLIAIQDSGPGMTPETAERILSGNARSQWDKGSGSGWGIKIVLELAATHDAKVTIDSVLGRGSTFTISVPHCPS
ncbi:MAG: GAF domain-containing sensor histidine kinase [Fimbriimonas sp.]|nr:GAF domain-containing sensor histidine kinase [Fimbriimonas sp.]